MPIHSQAIRASRASSSSHCRSRSSCQLPPLPTAPPPVRRASPRPSRSTRVPRAPPLRRSSAQRRPLSRTAQKLLRPLVRPSQPPLATLTRIHVLRRRLEKLQLRACTQWARQSLAIRWWRTRSRRAALAAVEARRLPPRPLLSRLRWRLLPAIRCCRRPSATCSTASLHSLLRKDKAEQRTTPTRTTWFSYYASFVAPTAYMLLLLTLESLN